MYNITVNSLKCCVLGFHVVHGNRGAVKRGYVNWLPAINNNFIFRN